MTIEQKLHSQFIIPVIREEDQEDLYSLCMALADGGLKVLEVTLMNATAFKVIKKLSAKSGLLIGAGTVLNEGHAQRAIDSGASFLVSPGLDKGAIDFSLSSNVPFIPGVLTPTEIMRAKSLGCVMVKIFPISSVGGAPYIKNLKGPFPTMKWMATGGVGLEDVSAYRKAGVTCVGLGTNLTPQDMIRSKNWKGITTLAEYALKMASESKES